MKLIFNAGSYKVSIPKQIVEIVLKWENKCELNVEYEKDKIVITKKEK